MNKFGDRNTVVVLNMLVKLLLLTKCVLYVVCCSVASSKHFCG